MRWNESCTWFHKLVDPETRRHTWEAHVLHGVNWQEERVASVTDRGYTSADIITVYIPLSAMPAGVSIQNEDRMSRGICAAEVPPEDAAVITSVVEYRQCSANMRHVEVTCR